MPDNACLRRLLRQVRTCGGQAEMGPEGRVAGTIARPSMPTPPKAEVIAMPAAALPRPSGPLA